MLLISGAAGNIGKRLARIASRNKIPARALVRKPEKFSVENVEVVAGHLQDPEALRAACKGCDTLFLLSRVDPDMATIQKEACTIAADAGVKRIVKLSGLDASPDARVTLGRWHGEIEKHIEGLGVAWTHLRPNAFMQNVLLGAKSIATSLEFASYSRPRGHVMGKCKNEANNVFRPSDSPLTEYEKEQIALRENLERLKAERLAREAVKEKDRRK